MKLIDATLFGPLSASVQEKLNRLTNTELFSTIVAMSGAPIIPWENLKWQYFGSDYKDYKFPTIHEIEVEPGFNTSTSVNLISSVAYDIHQTTIQQVTAIETVPLSAADKVGELDPDFIRGQIKFVEAVHTITPEMIEERPYEIAQKVLSYFLQIHKK